MDYNNDYHLVVDSILHNIGKKIDTEKDMQAITGIYNNIKDSIEYTKYLFNNDKIQTTVLSHNFITTPFSSSFISKPIQESIKKNIISQTIYKGYVYKQPIILNMYIIKGTLLSPIEMNDKAIKVFSWLHICNNYAKHYCKGSNTIEIYLTDFKKGFPNNSTKILTPDNINSGYSYLCSPQNTIVIFRLEEWFKVFVHESMHSYGLQPIYKSESLLDNALSDMLPLSCSIKVSEAYVETWARIINAMYSAIYNSDNIEDFKTIFDFTIQVESIFSIIQSYRVLSFVDLTYECVIDPTSILASKYKEQTNTFAYYVLCGAFMMNPYRFISWCATNNVNILQFNNTSKSVHSFEIFIKTSLHNKDIPILMKDYNHLINRKVGLRMSVADV